MTGSRSHRTFFEIWGATVPMVAICVVTIAANGAILTMFLSRRGLRRCKNLYFASLALADFLVGLTMPFKLTKDLHHTWDSAWGCRLYQSLRQSISYVSFLSIFLITLDKWRAVHYPVSYRRKTTKYMTISAVIIVWVLGFIVFTIPQIWWDGFIQAKIAESSRQNSGVTALGNGVNKTPGEHVVLGTNSADNKNSSRKVAYALEHDLLPQEGCICPEGYHLSFNLSISSTTLFYIIPLVVMLVFDISFYLKIKWRKSVEVQRSTSVTDTYFMTLKKPAMDLPESCMNTVGEDDAAKESLLKNSDNKPINKHLALGGARGERRHSSLPAISPIIKGRTSSGRRVSMPESNSGGGCRYVGRKWSGCATAFGNNQSQPPNPMANLAPRLHNEDMVHDILVKQDKKTARCLCLMLAALVATWLPHAVVSVVNSRCWCLFGTTITATSWFSHLDHAINPFLYGLMYVQFKNVLKQWLLIERVHAFKMRDTLILKNLQKKVIVEENNKHQSPNSQTRHSHQDLQHMNQQIQMVQPEPDNTPL